MRYYRIDFRNAGSSGAGSTTSNVGGSVGGNSNQIAGTITSQVNGQFDPGALDVEFDLPVAAFAEPMGESGAHVRIWGVPLAWIGQANNLNGKSIDIYGGMQKGLPLANPQQSGLLLSGTILQAFGNWIGTDQTLELVIFTETGTAPNLPVVWKKGTSMSDMINTTLTTGFPGYTADIQISDSLVFFQDVVGHYSSLTTFAQFVKATSASIFNPTGSTGPARAGVDITIKNQKFIVRDDTTAKQPKRIAFTDLIGQPTWIGPGQIQITVVMRADISGLDYIALPQTLISQTSTGSPPGSKNSSIFQGTFRVNLMRHVGRFRSPLAQDWVTVLDCTQVNTPTATTDATETVGG